MREMVLKSCEMHIQMKELKEKHLRLEKNRIWEKECDHRKHRPIGKT